ncbi:Uncharacterized conserved protein YjdB, contains Ig-like domain [Lachnospiraceae bacterium RM5]|nr:Uncharacterized conserved protein YjdB, contains Ig-like domain [Lachnospiraceae bacterium RM5]
MREGLKEKIKGFPGILLLSVAVFTIVFLGFSKDIYADDEKISITYSTHIQNIGWSEYSSDGEISGTMGQSKRIEAVKIKTDSPELGVKYRAFVQKEGWKEYVNDGNLSGTEGKGLRLEALQISLTGDKKDDYDVYYCAHVEKFGWLAWAKNGESAGTRDHSLRIEAIKIVLVKKGNEAPKNLSSDDKAFRALDLKYKSHVSKIGWQNFVGNGMVSGTTGAKKSIEAISIIENANADLNVNYSVHVSKDGWKSTVNNGVVSGTTGQAKSVQALKLSLSGKDASKYDIYYCVHVEKFGWLSWAKNGQVSGTTGIDCNVEALKVCILPKNSKAPDKLGSISKCYVANGIEYRICDKNKGWINIAKNGAIDGDTSSTVMMGMVVTLNNEGVYGNVNYEGLVQKDGWVGSVSNNTPLGNLSKGYRLEAIKISLSGDISNYYDVYYSVYVKNFGWTGFARNGEKAGSEGYGNEIKGLRVKLVLKGKAFNESRTNTFRKKPVEKPVVNIPNTTDPEQLSMYNMALGYASNTGYLILVNRSTHMVGIYSGKKGAWNEVKYIPCGDGKSSTPTPEGEHRVIYKKPYFDSGRARLWYTTNFAAGGYHFHSVSYAQTPTPSTILEGSLKVGISHGCVRLDINEAKWIYDNIPIGTKVIVYHNE